jgi:hypothetical protein
MIRRREISCLGNTSNAYVSSTSGVIVTPLPVFPICDGILSTIHVGSDDSIVLEDDPIAGESNVQHLHVHFEQ